MRTWFAILAFGGLWTVSLMTGGARAESVERQRADEVLQRLDGPDSQFTDLNVQKTVTPFETERPDETDLRPEDFDDEILKRRAGDGSSARVLQTSEDSIQLRPEIRIDPDAPLLDTANAAHENADALVGGYFEAGSGACEDPSILSEGFVEHFCQKRQLEETRLCELTRTVSVDRRETFDCEQQDATYIRTCTRIRHVSCSGVSGAACRKQSVAFSTNQIARTGTSVTWGVALAPQTGCVFAERSVQIVLTDSFQPASLNLSALDFAGFLQVEVGGEIIGTWPSGGTGGPLGIDTFGCGKNCSVQHPVINGAAIGDCTNTRATASPNADILRAVGHTTLHSLDTALTTERSTEITIRTVFRDAAPELRLTVGFDGPCCSAIDTSWETSCIEPTR